VGQHQNIFIRFKAKYVLLHPISLFWGGAINGWVESQIAVQIENRGGT